MPTPISFDASVQSLVVVAIVLCLVVVVMIIVADTAIARVETRPVEIELSFASCLYRVNTSLHTMSRFSRSPPQWKFFASSVLPDPL